MPYKIKINRPRAMHFVTDADPDSYEGYGVPSLSVNDSADVDTGLVDMDGNSIMRSPEKIGFH